MKPKTDDKTEKKKRNETLPHANLILECIWTALKRPIEMAMNLMLSLPTLLIQKRELKQSPHILTIACQGDENRNVE